MKTLNGIYKAVCLEVVGNRIRCKVSQVFADETVTCLASAGVVPVAGSEGWVAFESGFPDRPVWIGTNLEATVEPPPPLDSLDDLSDVDTTTSSPVDGQALFWNPVASQWMPGFPPTAPEGAVEVQNTDGTNQGRVTVGRTTPTTPPEGTLWFAVQNPMP